MSTTAIETGSIFRSWRIGSPTFFGEVRALFWGLLVDVYQLEVGG